MCFFSQVCMGQASLLVWVAGEDWCRVLQKEQTQVAEVGRVGEWGHCLKEVAERVNIPKAKE